MLRDEQHRDLMGAAEALLFVSDEPVSSARLADILEASPGEVDEALTLLAAEYMDENRGMQLREVAGGWRFYTHPAHHEIIERYVVSWDTHRMSQAALEALAIIAYHQPVTRAGINAIRGVNSEGVISSLVEKGLVREMGREKPGGAILYGTTRTFLERFGLKSVSDLPPLEDFAPDDESREYIRERLSGAGRDGDMRFDLDDEESADERSDVRIVLESGGSSVVEPVDSGDDERVDDAQGMSEVIGQAMTEKVDDYLGVDIEDVDGILDAYFGERDEEPASTDEDEEDDVIDEEQDDDDIFDAVEDAEEDEAYVYEDEEDEEPDDDDDDDEDDDIQIVE